jgi:molybdopterin converting factor small subunit
LNTFRIITKRKSVGVTLYVHSADNRKERDIIISLETIKPNVSDAGSSKSASMISVGFFGSIRESVNMDRDSVEITEDISLYNFLRTLVEIYGECFAAEIFNVETPDELRCDIMATINGTIIDIANAGQITLTQGDSVQLFPVFPGGG